MASRWWRVGVVVALAGPTTACDQLTKQYAADVLRHAPPASYAGDLVRIQYSENSGAFLSLGAGLSDGARFWVFTVGVAVLLVGLLGFVLLDRRLSRLSVAACALFLGGGLSNLIDRALHGSLVVDFLNLGIGPVVRTGIFNVADVAIVAGVALLVVGGLGLGERRRSGVPDG